MSPNRFSGSESPLVMLDMMFDDHVTKHAAILWWENKKIL